MSSQPALGRYRLLRHLATGGMADIFLAVARGIADFEKLVVLKRILPNFASDAEFVRRFLAEARLAATLQHANIVQVFDIGAEDGVYFFAMEYVVGVDLRHLLQATWANGIPIPLQHAVGIVMELSLGLHYAHEKKGNDGLPLGLVHRDVSPSNVLLGLEGVVKLADFGIAKATLLGRHTDPGRLLGKAPYMSPEQCLGEPVDRRSDIFSLGTLLYQLTTGRNPFLAPSNAEIWERITHEAIASPASVVADYPPSLSEIVIKALQRDRARRHATAEALHLDLEAFARTSGLPPSRIQLSRYIEQTFPTHTSDWRQAKEGGMSLVEFVTRTAGTVDVRPDGLESSADAPRARPSPDAGGSGGALAAMPTVLKDTPMQGRAGSAIPRELTRRVRLLLLAGLLIVAAGVILGITQMLHRPVVAPRSGPSEPAALAAPRASARARASRPEAAATGSNAAGLVPGGSHAGAKPQLRAGQLRRNPQRRLRGSTPQRPTTKNKTGTAITHSPDRRDDDDRLRILP